MTVRGAPPPVRAVAKAGQPWLPRTSDTFVAIDFETADRHSDSACAVGLVRVEAGEVAEVVHRLIRPPRNSFEHSWVHGITWDQVATAPAFVEVWAEIERLTHGCDFLCAHNAGFDKKVLQVGLGAAGHPVLGTPFHCTVQLARRTWKLPRHNLPTLCAHLGIALDHHNAASDAEACARIVLAAAVAYDGQP